MDKATDNRERGTDPHVILTNLRYALEDGETKHAANLAEALVAWLDRGGFPPAETGGGRPTTPDADDIIRTQLTEPLAELSARLDATEPHDGEGTEDVQEEARTLPLSLEVERTARLVLCTGGPHLEVRIAERTGIRGATVYAVWGTESKERGLTAAEADAVERFYGNDIDYVLEGAAHGNA